ncbi:MAG: hypothetical protein ACOCXI_15030 [Chloroflexota bacterium]
MSTLPQTGCVIYQVRVRGCLDDSWLEWFDGLTLSVGPDETVLRAPVRDQAALRGILDRMWDLNLEVISVSREGEGG